MKIKKPSTCWTKIWKHNLEVIIKKGRSDVISNWLAEQGAWHSHIDEAAAYQNLSNIKFTEISLRGQFKEVIDF